MREFQQILQVFGFRPIRGIDAEFEEIAVILIEFRVFLGILFLQGFEFLDELLLDVLLDFG